MAFNFKLTKKNKEILMYVALAVLAYFVLTHFMKNKTPSPVVEGFPGREDNGPGLKCRGRGGVFDYQHCLDDKDGGPEVCADLFVDQARVGGDSFMCGYIRGGKLGGSKVEPVHVDRNNALIVDRDCEEGQGRRCDGGDRFSEFKCSPNDSSKICYGDLIETIEASSRNNRNNNNNNNNNNNDMTTCIIDALNAKTTSKDPNNERAELIHKCVRNIGAGD